MAEKVTPEAVVVLLESDLVVDVDGAWCFVEHGGGRGDSKGCKLVGWNLIGFMIV